jgi:hypothetical protein
MVCGQGYWRAWGRCACCAGADTLWKADAAIRLAMAAKLLMVFLLEVVGYGCIFAERGHRQK